MFCALALIGLKSVSAQVPAGHGAVSCAACHEIEGRELAASVHGPAGVECLTCHGGERHYIIADDVLDAWRLRAGRSSDVDQAPSVEHGPQNALLPEQPFDHGPAFRGKASRVDIPETCGNCHADVALMNPYGLTANPLAQYWTSGHGRAILERQDERAAVCTDCHSTHDVLRTSDPASPAYAKNIPATCGACHSDPVIMADTPLSTTVVEEYRQSIHGRALLEEGDLGMPHCATCHGSHSAVPPGFVDVGHVCGRCHQQEEQHFMESPHAKFPLFPRCVGCHTRTIDRRDHRIERIATSPQAMRRNLEGILHTRPAADLDDPAVQSAFAARRDPPAPSFDAFCQRCHIEDKQIGHRIFFDELDVRAVELGTELYRLVQQAELQYAASAIRVDDIGRGVLLVTEEALMLDELRTMLVGLSILQHTLDLEDVQEAVGEIDELAGQINASLDSKVRGLRWRYWALLPMWAFIAVFVTALWIKYKQLKSEWVEPYSPENAGPTAELHTPTRSGDVP